MAKAGRDLSGPDRALATQLVYGVLRHRRYLDAWMAPWVRGELEPDIRDILRMALFQVGFLSRIPHYAIVHAAVEQAKQIRPQSAGLVNAILRRSMAKPPKNLSLAERYSHPDWLVDRWRRMFPDRVKDILAADNEVPPLTLRVNLAQIDRSAVVAALEACDVPADPSPYVPEAVRVMGSLWLEDFDPFQRGWVSVQDESGMLVTWVLAPRPGERVLDLTAGLGGKTTHVLEWLKGHGDVTAVDSAPSRLRLLKENVRRLGLTRGLETWQGDARSYGLRHPQAFDAVLLDAPCSGLGVLRRHVDARWKKQPEDLARHTRLQRQLLEAAFEAVRPGGRIVYSTCSFEPEETREMVDRFCEEHPELRVDSAADFLPHPDLMAAVHDDMATVFPGDFGMDGFFIARLVKEG